MQKGKFSTDFLN